MNPHPASFTPDQPLFGVIIPEVDKGRLEQVCRRAGVAVQTLEALLSDYVIRRDAAAKAIAVEAPTIFIGAIFTSEEGSDALATELEALELFCSLLKYEQHHVSVATDPRLLEWLTARITHAAGLLVHDSAALRRALGLLRAENEQMLRKFATLEAAAGSSTPQRVSKLRFPASRASVTLPARDPTCAGFSQRLPLSPRGLASIVLEVARKPRGPTAYLEVALRLARGKDIIEMWRLPTEEMKPGPLPLRLTRALDRSGVDILLEVRLEGEPTSEFALSLSSPTPLGEYSLITPEGVVVGSPLALAAWGSTPGLVVAEDVSDEDRIAPLEQPLPSKKTPARTHRYPLFADELEGAVRIAPVDVSPTFNVVDFRREEGDLLVHPVDGQVTVAAVVDLKHHQVQGVSATVVVENLASAPVEFGLAVVPRQAAYSNPGDLIRSWTRVEPLIFSEIRGEVHSQRGEPVDLLLATRMADGAPAHLAWAVFKRVEILA